MAKEEIKYKVSQEYEIVPHQKGKAYPISIIEWNFIKKKLKKITIKVNNFNKIGFLLLGASVPCFIAFLATDSKDNFTKYISLGLCGLFLICGLLSVYFSREKHKEDNAKPTEIIDYMDLIETRFENSET